MGKTEKNLNIAFEGEAKAVVRLRLYADKAEQDGYPQMAKLFRAISEAEVVHAKLALKNMGKLKSTEENLQESFESEMAVSENTYPQLIQDALEEGENTAARGFTHARDAEEFHASLYKKALEHFAKEEDAAYYVCKVCGYVVDGEIPDECPICGAKAKAFFEVK